MISICANIKKTVISPSVHVNAGKGIINPNE